MKKLTALILCFALPLAALADDVVRMKNGDVYRGEILEQEMDQYIQIRFTDGNEKRIPWKGIKKVEKETPEQPKAQAEPRPTKERPGSGTITAGWVVLGVAYAGSVFGGLATGTAITCIPVFGNFAQIAFGRVDSTTLALNVVAGVAQFTGITLLLVGYSSSDTGNVHVLPTPSGLELAMRF